MTESLNPYQSPDPLASGRLSSARQISRFDRFVCVAWPITFVLNMIVPALIGWDITSQSGRSGMITASLLLFIGGWCACLAWPWLGRKVVTGAVVLALSQLFPVIQIIAGVLAFWMAEMLGLAKERDDLPIHAVGELGGFLVTLVVGAILVGAAAVIGICLRSLFPQRTLTATGETARAL